MRYFQFYYSNKINPEIVKLKESLQETVKLHSEALNPLKGENDGFCLIESTENKINDNYFFIENNAASKENNINNGVKNKNSLREFCSERTAKKWRTVHAGYSEFLTKSLDMSR
jgi:hypothetical protein